MTDGEVMAKHQELFRLATRTDKLASYLDNSEYAPFAAWVRTIRDEILKDHANLVTRWEAENPAV